MLRAISSDPRPSTRHLIFGRNSILTTGLPERREPELGCFGVDGALHFIGVNTSWRTPGMEFHHQPPGNRGAHGDEHVKGVIKAAQADYSIRPNPLGMDAGGGGG